ncbi:replicative DNA helicase [Membranicola marinus]|uniref:Replicative DNA helicase n=1 Tax=Membranihabitans marinus TaxID=1227546 RepID=A0A953HTA8_9BACT|nr:replicative DNA helicase [Membranihabitans marinus]MBY5957831.1 replicative DNA helicase [Membranihabitans marinus]
MSDQTNYAKPIKSNKLKALKPDSDLNRMVYGKIQPQALELEEAVLGAIMLDRDAMPDIIDLLRPDSFYHEAHQIIYEAMQQLFNQAKTIDLLTMHEELLKMGKLQEVGGAAYLAELTERVASAANIEYHARIIAQKHIKRELIRVSTKTITNAFDDTIDVFELLDDSERNLFDITQQNLNRSYESLSSLAGKAQRKMEELASRNESVTGVPSGYTNLDKLTSGWQPSDLIIIAARPGMGKTSFTLALAKNAALLHNKGVAFFSLEMSDVQLTQRLISMESGVSLSKLRTGKLEEEEWRRFNGAVEDLSEVPIYIDDTPSINIFELRAKCRRLKIKHDIQMVMIDYLQLMTGGVDKKNGTREQEISSISRALKAMAKELEVPVIALSQLSRAVETRSSDKRPMLSDLRESGAIEQDADLVSFIYRPEYYDIQSDEMDQSLDGIAEIIVAKHRNGPTDTIKLKFIPEYTRFENLDEFSFPSFDDESSIKPSRMNMDEDVPF